MSCYRRSPPKLSISALNSVRGAQYYANYSARYIVGSKPTPKAKPKPAPVKPHAGLQGQLAVPEACKFALLHCRPAANVALL